MAITKTPNQPSEYLKVTENSLIKHIPSYKVKGNTSIDENGNTIIITPDTIVKARVEFVVGWMIFQNQQARVESETNEWIVKKYGTATFDFVPELPEDWAPIDPEDIESEKLITRCYLAISTLPEFTGWVKYQPETNV